MIQNSIFLDAVSSLKEETSDAGVIDMKENLPKIPKDALILMPLQNIVIFPGMVVPIQVGREVSILAAQAAIKHDSRIGIILQKDPKDNDPNSIRKLHEVGTVANILRYITSSSESHHLVCQGEKRFRIKKLLKGYPFLVAKVEYIVEKKEKGVEIDARMVQLKQRASDVLNLMPEVPPEIASSIANINAPDLLTDLLIGFLDISAKDRQSILEILDLKERMDKVLELMKYRVEVLQVSRDIDLKTQERIGDRQREALLREQLRTIQKQLGDDYDEKTELEELKEAITKAKMPEEADKHAKKELNRLKNMSTLSGEYSVVRTYLEWLTELPWSVSSPDQTDITKARTQLDLDHYGLTKVKRRILEFLAVHKLNPKGKSPLLCFVGPPGVGKTSLGQSIAKSTGKAFARVSMGGVHDEAEIRGHRRTYLGALPGNIIQAIKRAGTNNCVMMLDEVDKLGVSVQGDPSAALLEVLDPEQNHAFRDNYLSVSFDLSQVMFICTANVVDTIPTPLRDRMEMIEIPGYTQAEKLQIATRYLIKRQIESNGLKAKQCQFTKDSLLEIIQNYTREAGVRHLEREIAAVCRHIAVQVTEGQTSPTKITQESIHTILGAPRFENDVAMRTALPGVATGLAWTPVGGDILFIEATKTFGKNKLTLTGQLGDVMKESATAALTLLKARAKDLGIDASLFESHDIHIHIPAGAIPKDGPSAGITLFLALASLMLEKPILADHAMTGEISLRGLVLPVGGIKEKVLAAHRAGIKTVMIPKRNEKDLDDIPKDAKKKMKFVFLETVDDALKEAMKAAKKLTKVPTKKKA